MLAEYFESPQRIQEFRDGPPGYLFEGFARADVSGGLRRDNRSAAHSRGRAPYVLDLLEQVDTS